EFLEVAVEVEVTDLLVAGGRVAGAGEHHLRLALVVEQRSGVILDHRHGAVAAQVLVAEVVVAERAQGAIEHAVVDDGDARLSAAATSAVARAPDGVQWVSRRKKYSSCGGLSTSGRMSGTSAPLRRS